MKNIKWYTWIGMALLFVIAIATFVKIFSSADQMAHSETMTVKVESEEVDHLIQMETETKEAGSLTSVKSIPFTLTEAIDKPIKKWANKKESTFFSEMRKAEVLLDHNASAHFSVKSKVTPLTEALYHITLSSEQSVDQEESHLTIKTFTIDLDEEELVGLNKITKEKLTLGKLFIFLKKHSDADLDHDEFHKQYETLNDIDWTAGKENIVFYFNSDITSSNENKVIVPLMDFYSYLKDDYYSSLISDELNEEIKQKEKKEKKKREKEEREKKATLKRKKMMALTFDDGPHPDQTVRILDTLEKFDAKATFFVLGNNVKQHPDVAKRIVEEGHDLANHSMSHANLNAVTKDQAKTEIFNSQAIIEKKTGKKPTLFRPPYGNFKDDTEAMINESEQDIILWSVDTHDWDSKNADAIYQTVKAHTVPGSIVLMHDIYPTTADALPKILNYFKKQGYETVTISELMPYIEDTNKGTYFGY